METSRRMEHWQERLYRLRVFRIQNRNLSRQTAPAMPLHLETSLLLIQLVAKHRQHLHIDTEKRRGRIPGRLDQSNAHLHNRR
jgi:hypothetical protein